MNNKLKYFQNRIQIVQQHSLCHQQFKKYHRNLSMRATQRAQSLFPQFDRFLKLYETIVGEEKKGHVVKLETVISKITSVLNSKDTTKSRSDGQLLKIAHLVLDKRMNLFTRLLIQKDVFTMQEIDAGTYFRVPNRNIQNFFKKLKLYEGELFTIGQINNHPITLFIGNYQSFDCVAISQNVQNLLLQSYLLVLATRCIQYSSRQRQQMTSIVYQGLFDLPKCMFFASDQEAWDTNGCGKIWQMISKKHNVQFRFSKLLNDFSTQIPPENQLQKSRREAQELRQKVKNLSKLVKKKDKQIEMLTQVREQQRLYILQIQQKLLKVRRDQQKREKELIQESLQAKEKVNKESTQAKEKVIQGSTQPKDNLKKEQKGEMKDITKKDISELFYGLSSPPKDEKDQTKKQPLKQPKELSSKIEGQLKKQTSKQPQKVSEVNNPVKVKKQVVTRSGERVSSGVEQVQEELKQVEEYEIYQELQLIQCSDSDQEFTEISFQPSQKKQSNQ